MVSSCSDGGTGGTVTGTGSLLSGLLSLVVNAILDSLEEGSSVLCVSASVLVSLLNVSLRVLLELVLTGQQLGVLVLVELLSLHVVGQSALDQLRALESKLLSLNISSDLLNLGADLGGLNCDLSQLSVGVAPSSVGGELTDNRVGVVLAFELSKGSLVLLHVLVFQMGGLLQLAHLDLKLVEVFQVKLNIDVIGEGGVTEKTNSGLEGFHQDSGRLLLEQLVQFLLEGLGELLLDLFALLSGAGSFGVNLHNFGLLGVSLGIKSINFLAKAGNLFVVLKDLSVLALDLVSSSGSLSLELLNNAIASGGIQSLELSHFEQALLSQETSSLEVLNELSFRQIPS